MGETQAIGLHKAQAPAYIPRGQMEAVTATLFSFHCGKPPEVAAAAVL